MRRSIEFSPARLGHKPDPKKYYGVTTPNYENGNEHINPCRSFIAAWDGYPNPQSFVLICATKMTAGNTWDDVKEKNNKHERISLESFIIWLYQRGNKVYEFDTARELFDWLGDCEDKKSRKETSLFQP